MDQLKKDSRASLILYAIISFVLVFSLSFLVLIFIEKEVRETRIEELKRQEKRVVRLENDFLGQELRLVLSDLHYLHHAYQDDLLNAETYDDLINNWLEFSAHRRVYDQIRFIDAGGNEKIRINRDDNGAYVVAEKQLQNKCDRYYFEETIKLAEESVYLSPLDLNIENGEIEVPYKPMLRISTPIYDDVGTLKGIIVLNYLAESMLSDFRRLANNNEGEMILLNASGYSLSSANPENDWNFMFEDKKDETFAKTYPDGWRSIINNESQITRSYGLLTSTPLALSYKFTMNGISNSPQKIVFGDGTWYIVSVFRRTSENAPYFEDHLADIAVYVLVKNVFYFLLITIVSIIVGFLVYINRKTYTRIKFYSEFDALTKTYNRRAGIARINNLFPANERRSFVASLCFIDINGLKTVNDTLGHKFGDELIVSAVKVIKDTIRDEDFLIRLGGDEFLIVFSGVDTTMAENTWNRIVQAYDVLNEDENRPYIISVSHGIVDFDNKHKTRVDQLINLADEKMYDEKQLIKAKLDVIKQRGHKK